MSHLCLLPDYCIRVDGWTWRIAEAVADGTEPPRICSDRPVAPECLRAIEAAMDLR